MRPSEMPRQALERELREELGVASTIGDALGIVRHRYKEMAEAVQVVFVRASLEGTPRNLAFERIVWARRAELGRYDFLAADRRVIAGLAGGAFAFVRSLNPERRSLAQGSVRDGPAAVDRQNLSRHIRSAH